MATYQIPRKIAMINDIAGYGRCSTTVSLPVISAMKVQVCPVPTSVFSNHTAFPEYYMEDLTAQLPAYLDTWNRLELRFDGIYSGFLGSVRQIRIVENFIASRKEGLCCPLVIIDPVMGDHGKAYRTITEAHCLEMKNLIRAADIITPNITEACLLTDTSYQENGWSEDALGHLARQLRRMGPEKIVITGIREEHYYVNFIYDHGDMSVYRVPVAGESRPGTGDIFASIVAADCVNGSPLFTSVTRAADFIRICIEASSALNIPVEEGVCFENFLSLLIV